MEEKEVYRWLLRTQRRQEAIIRLKQPMTAVQLASQMLIDELGQVQRSRAAASYSRRREVPHSRLSSKPALLANGVWALVSAQALSLTRHALDSSRTPRRGLAALRLDLLFSSCRHHQSPHPANAALRDQATCEAQRSRFADERQQRPGRDSATGGEEGRQACPSPRKEALVLRTDRNREATARFANIA